MDFPDRDLALAWVGRTLVDRDGAEIGACTAVFSDDATQLTEWVRSELGGAAVFIPAVGAAESSRQVQVAVSRADVAEAPSVRDAQHISAEEEAALYRHYGIPHSRDASPTLLPTGDRVAGLALPDLITCEHLLSTVAHRRTIASSARAEHRWRRLAGPEVQSPGSERVPRHVGVRVGRSGH